MDAEGCLSGKQDGFFVQTQVINMTAQFDNDRRNNKRAISAKGVIIPSILVILFFDLLIIYITFLINRTGKEISEMTQKNFVFSEMSGNFSQGVDALVELAGKYVSTLDEDVLNSYFSQYHQMMESGNALADEFGRLKYDESYEKMKESIAYEAERNDLEKHAIRLCAGAAALNLSAYPELQKYTLTPEEEQLSPALQHDAAVELMASRSYQAMRGSIQKALSMAVHFAADRTAAEIEEKNRILSHYRVFQWILMGLGILVLVAMSVLLFVRLLIPLEKSVEVVQRGDEIPVNKGFAELQRLAASYVELLHYRNKLENNLRTLSMTDALTGLPNRLAFEDYVSNFKKDADIASVTVFSMDVNCLKETNDSKGHLYGDRLLRDAAVCILSAFGDSTGRNCFRFGGDEFAAFWINEPEEKIGPALKQFKREQEKRDVSISVGYARTGDISGTTVKELFEKADRYMYSAKAVSHSREPHQG